MTDELTMDAHPLDESLGNIHQISIMLAYAGKHDLAKALAEAHVKIQQYLIDKEL